MSPSVNVRFILCGLSGIATGLAHQPYIPGFIAWISLLPFIYSLNSFTTLRRSIIGGWVFGLFYVSIIIYWLSQNIGTSQTIAWISLVVASLFLALNYIIISVWFYILTIFNKMQKSTSNFILIVGNPFVLPKRLA